MLLSFDDVFSKLEELESSVAASCDLYPAAELGLDPRCGTILVAEDFLATSNRRSLDYYGGFEYIDAEHIQQVGGLTLYSIQAPRVLNAIHYLEHHHD